MSVVMMRLKLVDTRDPDEAIHPVVIDIRVDDAGAAITEMPTTGWWGTFKYGDDLLPFILRPDGRMDFGSDYEDDERFGHTNLLKKKIGIGELASVSLDGEDVCMRIASADPLAG